MEKEIVQTVRLNFEDDTFKVIKQTEKTLNKIENLLAQNRELLSKAFANIVESSLEIV